jgi:hypothetical protein
MDKSQQQKPIIVDRKRFEDAVAKLLKSSPVPLSEIKSKRQKPKTNQSRKVRQK